MKTEALAMFAETMLFCSQFARWDLPKSFDAFCNGRRPGKQFPGAKAVQGSAGQTSLTIGAQQTASSITKVAFQVIVGTGKRIEVTA